MEDEQGRNLKFQVALLFSIFSVIQFLLLVVFRVYDDNALTSWSWVFIDSTLNHHKFFSQVLIFSGLIILANLLSFLVSSHRLGLINHKVALPFLAIFLTLPFWQIPELIVDTARYFTYAKYMASFGLGEFLQQWGVGFDTWTDLFSVPFIYGLIFKIFGESRLYIQILNTLFFSSSVFLTFLIGKKIWSEEIGYLGGFFLLAIPYLFSQVPLMLVDIAVLFLFIFFVYIYLLALSTNHPLHIFLGALAAFFLVFAKYSTWLLLSIVPLILIIYSERTLKQRIWTTFFIIILLLIFSSSVIAAKYSVFKNQVLFLKSYQWSGLKRWGEAYLSTFFFQSHPYLPILGIYGAFQAFKTRDKKFLILFWSVIFILIFDLRRIRYTLPLFPFFALMAGYGLSRLGNGGIKRFIAWSAVLTSFAVAFFLFLPFLKKNSTVNLMAAGNFLNQLPGQSVEVITDKQVELLANTAVAVPILDLHTDKEIIYTQKIDKPAEEEIRNLSLRFTWNLETPAYYQRILKEKSPQLVLISSRIRPPQSKEFKEKIKHYTKRRIFQETCGVFKMKFLVTVYYN
jgi:4-amino-4-deoxy-L-arabinose transferase-like glycosyltransferase